MAPKKAAKASASQAQHSSTHSHSDETSLDASLDMSQVMDLQTMQASMDKHKLQVKQRRDTRRGAIIAKHKQNLAQTKTDLEACNARYDQAWRTIHRRKIEHLLTLLRQKEAIEARIDACTTQVEQGFSTLSTQVETAIAQRMDRTSVNA